MSLAHQPPLAFVDPLLLVAVGWKEPIVGKAHFAGPIDRFMQMNPLDVMRRN